MSDEQKARENEVFDQELSMDDLDAVAGGDALKDIGATIVPGVEKVAGAIAEALRGPDEDQSNCTKYQKRPMYGGGGFPNCVATVEDGSHCGTNDAYYDEAVDYQGLIDCAKAWRYPSGPSLRS